MSSIFSFMRPGEEMPGEEPVPEPAAGEEPTPELVSDKAPVPPPPAGVPIALAGAPPLENVISHMLDSLSGYLPPPAPSLPDPSVSVVRVAERSVGIGNHLGTERRGPLAVIALKGGRLDGVVRFQLWGSDPAGVDTAVDALHGRLLSARDDLWGAGFLRFAADDTSVAEHVSSLNAWRKTTDYKLLYEFRYTSTDDAQSIIARIPIHSDLEERDSLQRETTVVTDEIVRWDNQRDGEDPGAPPLEVSGATRSEVQVTGLASLAYLPTGWTGNQVTLARLDGRTIDPPTTYPSLEQFLTAVTDPSNPDRNAEVTFGSLDDFLAEFESAGDPIELGDWDEDGTPDEYQPGALAFERPIRLETGSDFVRLSYADSEFDTPAVVYLRARVRGS